MSHPPQGSSGENDRDAMAHIAQRLIAPFHQAALRGQRLADVLPFEAAPDTRANRKDHNAIEAIVRLLVGLAPILESRWHSARRTDDALAGLQRILVDTVADGMTQFETPVKGGQALVEAALLATAVLRAPQALWHSLDQGDRAVLRRALQGSRAIVPNQTNWLLFPAMVETALIVLDGQGDEAPTLRALTAFETWYLGDGVYGDGPLNSCDYYGGFIIHPMLDDMARHLAPHLPDWARARSAIRTRFDRYCEVLERLIAPDGSFPPLGRSLTYRAAVFQPLAIAALRADGHASLPRAQLRRALSAVTSRTMAGAQHYDANGWLRIGLAGPQPALAETYISTGSLYLCSQALLVLALPPKHAFWADADLPLTQEVIWRNAGDLPADIALEKRTRKGAPRK
jgi:hypothetical protein